MLHHPVKVNPKESCQSLGQDRSKRLTIENLEIARSLPKIQIGTRMQPLSALAHREDGTNSSCPSHGLVRLIQVPLMMSARIGKLMGIRKAILVTLASTLPVSNWKLVSPEITGFFVVLFVLACRHILQFLPLWSWVLLSVSGSVSHLPSWLKGNQFWNWRGDSVVKNMDHSCRRPRFDS